MGARLRTRFFAAGVLVAFAFSAMPCRYFAATYDRVPNAVFLAGCAGVALFAAGAAVSAAVYREVNSVLVFRLSMVAAVAAFFPMNPGSWLSIVFALSAPCWRCLRSWDFLPF